MFSDIVYIAYNNAKYKKNQYILKNYLQYRKSCIIIIDTLKNKLTQNGDNMNKQETIIIKLPSGFKKAIEDESKRRCYNTTSEFIRDQLRFCLPENIGKQTLSKNEFAKTGINQ